MEALLPAPSPALLTGRSTEPACARRLDHAEDPSSPRGFAQQVRDLGHVHWRGPSTAVLSTHEPSGKRERDASPQGRRQGPRESPPAPRPLLALTGPSPEVPDMKKIGQVGLGGGSLQVQSPNFPPLPCSCAPAALCGDPRRAEGRWMCRLPAQQRPPRWWGWHSQSGSGEKTGQLSLPLTPGASRAERGGPRRLPCSIWVPTAPSRATPSPRSRDTTPVCRPSDQAGSAGRPPRVPGPVRPPGSAAGVHLHLRCETDIGRVPEEPPWLHDQTLGPERPALQVSCRQMPPAPLRWSAQRQSEVSRAQASREQHIHLHACLLPPLPRHASPGEVSLVPGGREGGHREEGAAALARGWGVPGWGG